ncbi:enoyl-CoA hydratase/isomerase family protein [Novosphingobium sp. JCM 18896]|uniref:enoyl-CoA hydratase/isomerase family protein n=1 Tax=Novosphingobium sp. JCM 18896 TaxID=2989731 RepID=UPI0022219686|nr:enoyl-CoA hydratase/isomerase family protein [Novosphingobium sp. JCM 18896]MCW1431186.1 enoyl-CoA hydratase/isomerase family protein [Novosphingobium sp. JCM 18896]
MDRLETATDSPGDREKMDIRELIVPAERLWPGEAWAEVPLAFVDLDRTDGVPESLALPPCPVIGLGDPEHPLAAHLDAVIEPPVGAEAIARQVMARPRSAAVIVQLLRLLPDLSSDAGLAAESLAYAVLQGSDEHLRWRAAQPPAARRAEGRLRVEPAGEALVLTLASPENGNAIDRHLRDALHEALSLAALDPGIARIELRAEGKAFSLGAELGEFGTTTDPATAHAIRLATLPARPASRCADRLDVHVQGACVGAGLELAAWARRIVATENAWFQLPELAMGVLPGAGGCVALTRRIGRQRTALMILSGKRLNARQALGWGLIDEIA